MDVIKKTKSWIEKFVIGLNLCPFANHPFVNNRIRYRLEETNDLEKLVATFIEELEFLQKKSNHELETTFIIHPNLLNDFLDYNDFQEVINAILEKYDLEGVLQVAMFHPDFQFAGEDLDAPSNYVTRSPFPMLHILREESVEKAIHSHSNTNLIPEENIQKMNDLGLEGIQKMIGDLIKNS